MGPGKRYTIAHSVIFEWPHLATPSLGCGAHCWKMDSVEPFGNMRACGEKWKDLKIFVPCGFFGSYSSWEVWSEICQFPLNPRSDERGGWSLSRVAGALQVHREIWPSSPPSTLRWLNITTGYGTNTRNLVGKPDDMLRGASTWLWLWIHINHWESPGSLMLSYMHSGCICLGVWLRKRSFEATSGRVL